MSMISSFDVFDLYFSFDFELFYACMKSSFENVFDLGIHNVAYQRALSYMHVDSDLNINISIM